MSKGEPIVRPAPDGPPLSWLATALAPERHPVLLDSGARSGARSNDGPRAASAEVAGLGVAEWHLLFFDPVEVLTHRVGDPGPRGLARVAAALERHFGPGPLPAATPDQDEVPAFRGGVAGWLSYDLGRELERVGGQAAPDGDIPDLMLGVYPFALAEAVATGRRLVVGRGTPEQAEAFGAAVAELGAAARRPVPPTVGAEVTSTFDRPAYVRAIERVLEHIRDGDVYQVNIAQRFAVDFTGDPEAVLAALAEHSPAPFGAVLRTPTVAVVSNSPELFLRRRGDEVICRPIKGTRPRGLDAADDARLRAELEASPKEQAELAMIVDLVRNDLGRVAALGSVRVEGEFVTEAWPTVFHRVATVRASIPGVPSCALIEAAFPPASVTGTPKIRSQQVIDALEPVRRHVYTGAIGWIGADGELDLSVAIRIATLVGGRLAVPVGGGITLESDPQAEYEETLHKARAMFEVLGLTLPATGVPA